MENEFKNKRYTTLVRTREIRNCVTGEKSKFPNEYSVYDNVKESEAIIPNFHPYSYDEIREKAIELNNNTHTKNN